MTARGGPGRAQRPHPAKISSPREDVLTIWTVYQDPPSAPGQFVVRGYDVHAGGRVAPRPESRVCASLDEARAAVPAGLYWMNRNPVDDPAIVETWV